MKVFFEIWARRLGRADIFLTRVKYEMMLVRSYIIQLH